MSKTTWRSTIWWCLTLALLGSGACGGQVEPNGSSNPANDSGNGTPSNSSGGSFGEPLTGQGGSADEVYDAGGTEGTGGESPPPEPSSPWVARTIPQRFGIQLKNFNANARNLELVGALNFGWIRRGFSWNAIEQTAGEYDFSQYDVLVENAQTQGLRIIAVIGLQNPALYPPVHEAEGRAAYARYAAALAEHFQDANIIWELWNEPNVRTFWGWHGEHNSEQYAQEYTSLVKETMAAIQEVAPDSTVVAGSVSNLWQASYEWQQHCFELGILETGIAGWSVHPYGLRTPEEYLEGYRIVRQMLSDAGAPDMPLLNSERGFPLEEREGFAGGAIELAQEFQAWHMVRQYLIDHLSDLQLTIWYEWSGEETFSFYTANYRTPVYEAGQTLFSLLEGYELRSRLETDSSLDFLLKFYKTGAPDYLVAWTAPEPDDTPDSVAPHNVSISVDQEGWVEVVDLYGNTDSLQITDGQLQVPLSGSPVYIKLQGMAERSTATTRFVPRQELDLFESGTTWTFYENNSDGAFELGHEADVPIGRIHYDFNATANDAYRDYVYAETAVTIPAARGLQLQVRTEVAQQLTLRIIDSTEQTHQFKTQLSGSNEWETVFMPFENNLENWGGAADGTIHFPLQRFVLSVPEPNNRTTGSLTFSRAYAVSY